MAGWHAVWGVDPEGGSVAQITTKPHSPQQAGLLGMECVCLQEQEITLCQIIVRDSWQREELVHPIFTA